MTTVQINLPDALVQRARSEGLLSDGAIQRMLEDAMRRQAGRRLMQVAERLHAADIEPMTEDEIEAEIQASRAEHRASQIDPSKPPHSSQ
ncbi:MAG TPA: hypothetical protein VLJ57_20945 [Burkholderiaceae bacterium]|nr:hypothetical protein [Burkholderiaceae bacterium]